MSAFESLSGASETMAEVDIASSATPEDFLASGRTGRRNALGDITDSQQTSVETGSLPLELEKLKCSDESQTTKSSAAVKSKSTTESSGS